MVTGKGPGRISPDRQAVRTAAAAQQGTVSARISVNTGEIRIGPIISLPGILTALKVPPRRVFLEAKVPLALFDHPDNRISLIPLCRLLSAGATLSRRNDLGLLLAEHFTLASLGSLGELMRNSATVGEAIRMLMLHLHYYDRAAIPVMLRSHSQSVFLGYSLQNPSEADTTLVQDAAIAIAYKLLRELCGASWQPGMVQFSHRQPVNQLPYRRFFGRGVRFDAEITSLMFAASWLEQPIAGADPAIWYRVSRSMQNAEAGWPMGFAEEVQCVLHQLLAGGAVSAAGVAQLFGCSERTLRQKLQSEGASMQKLLNDVRFELARHLLQGTKLPISHIAGALCYADSAVFSRAFHGWAGKSPRQWRNENWT